MSPDDGELCYLCLDEPAVKHGIGAHCWKANAMTPAEIDQAFREADEWEAANPVEAFLFKVNLLARMRDWPGR